MRRVVLLSVLCLSVGALNGCNDETVIATENIPTAGVRFINGVPDTAGAFGMDLRWVDQLESNAHFRILYRSGVSTSGGVSASTAVQYKGVRAGSRHFRIFLDDTLQSVASVVLKDSTVTLEAGKNYTAILWGYSRVGQTPSIKLSFFEETVAAPGANQVAVRVLNATGGPIDVRQYETGTAVPGAPTWAAVAALSASTHILVDTGLIRFNVQPAGGGAPLFADAQLLAGAPASSTAGPTGRLDIEALPGTRVPGSAVTFIVWPPSVTGARTPQTAAFQVPAGSSIWDRRPPYIP